MLIAWTSLREEREHRKHKWLLEINVESSVPWIPFSASASECFQSVLFYFYCHLNTELEFYCLALRTVQRTAPPSEGMTARGQMWKSPGQNILDLGHEDGYSDPRFTRESRGDLISCCWLWRIRRELLLEMRRRAFLARGTEHVEAQRSEQKDEHRTCTEFPFLSLNKYIY